MVQIRSTSLYLTPSIQKTGPSRPVPILRISYALKRPAFKAALSRPSVFWPRTSTASQVIVILTPLTHPFFAGLSHRLSPSPACMFVFCRLLQLLRRLGTPVSFITVRAFVFLSSRFITPGPHALPQPVHFPSSLQIPPLEPPVPHTFAPVRRRPFPLPAPSSSTCPRS